MKNIIIAERAADQGCIGSAATPPSGTTGYARFVGRVGVLAVAFGVGGFIGVPAVVSADPGQESAGGSASADSPGEPSRGQTGSARRGEVGPDQSGPAPAPSRGARGSQSTAAVGSRPSKIASPDDFTGPALPPVTRQPAPLPTPSSVEPNEARTATPRQPALGTVPAATPPQATAITAAYSTPALTAAPAAAVPAAATRAATAPSATAAPAFGALAAVLAPLSGAGTGAPIESPASWMVMAAVRRSRAAVRPAPAATVTTGQSPAPAAATGTTTAITWNYGTNTVLNFNPVTDKLDFGWFQPANFDVTEKSGSTQIAIVGNNQTYTLTNVPLSSMSMTNIVAKDTTTVTKWQTMISGAQTVTPTVSVANAGVAEGNSGTTNAGFAVTLSKASTKTVTVGYSTANGTATAGSDYTATSGTLTFAPGVTTQTVNVSVTGDTAVEPTETFTVILANPVGAALGAATATGTITNDDTATPPPATADRWGTTFYAPYVDMGGWPVPDLLAISQTNGGGSLFTAAFMQATPDGKLAWAGLSALEPGATGDQAQAINRSIKAIQAAGGDVMISLGGQAGTSLAQWGSTHGMTAQQLADAYAGVVNTYGVTHLDFDIEGAAVADPTSIALHSQALKLLQQSKPEVKVWYTLPVLPAGLTSDGLKVVDSALRAGVTLAGVNVMAMDFGESAAPTSGPSAKTMGAYAIQSAESTYGQLTNLYKGYGKSFGYGQLGVTPMLGVNDVTTEVFTLADAQSVEDYARAKGLGMVGLWSVTRDTPGSLGQSTPTASGLSAPAGSFAKIFNDYGTVNALKYPTSGGGGSTTPVTGGSTTTIGWNYGANTVLNFNPATDKLDFGWFQPANFDVTEKAGSTQIAIVGNNQTYTLSGVALSKMSMGNIIAKDTATLSKWQTLISGAQTATPTTAPAISVANATVTEGNSGTGKAAFTMTLSKAATSTVTVGYATANGTATAGQDYTAATGTLTFAPGVTTQTLNVTVTGDATVEPNETFTVTLTNPVGATLGTATATGTITNDDAAAPAPAPATATTTKILAAYYPEWGIYGRNFQVADVPAGQLTHLIYSFLDLTSAGEVAIYDSYAAVEKRFTAAESVSGEADLWYYPPSDPRSQQTVWGNFNQIAQLKQKNPNLRVSIALGGWTLSKNFSTVASTAAGREKLANSIVTFLDTYRMFDGIDFDWEYPGGGGMGGNSASPNDGANYAELLKVVRTRLDTLGAKNGRRYDISVASPAGYDKITNFNLAGLAPSVDFFNVMAYDFHGTWEKTTGHQSAFTGDPKGYDVQTAIKLYLAAGVNPGKIVLGAPLYTRGWSGVADGGDGGYLEATSGAAPGTFEAGVYDYKDLLAQLKDPTGGWKLYWDDNAQAAYVHNAAKGLFSSFETPTSIAQKSEWAQAVGLGGMMFWDITNDAVGSPDSLVSAAYSSWVLHNSLSAIRGGSGLPGEVIIGGDGKISALPVTTTQTPV